MASRRVGASGIFPLFDKPDALTVLDVRPYTWEEQLTAACERDPSLGYHVLRRLLEVVSRRLQATERRLAEFWGVGSLSTRRASQPCA